MKHQKGLHHITALAGTPKTNAEFYIQQLGLRLIKKSVNQDDPGTYHLFYGNEQATPGSSLTFFPWPRAHKGTKGSGESVNVAFKVPEHSAEFWKNHLDQHSIKHSEFFDVFGKQAIRFEDPDGLELDLVFDGAPKSKELTFDSVVPAAHAIQGFESTRLNVNRAEGTVDILKDIMGFDEVKSSGDQTLFSTEASVGSSVIVETTTEQPGRGGRGIIHHVAFRAEDMEDLKSMREQVLSKGLDATGVIDRHWFKSVYFREPGGVLFEIATDDPGYTVDEDFNHLGEKLILAPWLEAKREVIESILPNIDLPK
jgi:glyoxalase family protein